MSKVNVVFWSQSGNTESMANAVGAGVTEAGGEANVVFVGDASIDELKSAKAFALGCPAMGAEVLEEGEMEPYRFRGLCFRKDYRSIRLLRLGRRTVDARLG